MASYAHPETLVDTDWLVRNLEAKNQRIVEVDVDVYSYEEGHIPGAVGWNWAEQLCDRLRRDILSQSAFEKLMSESGITENTTIILYGDNNNWFAAWAFWQMKIYGHKDVRLLNGGRRKWLEQDLPLTADVPLLAPSAYKAKPANMSLRAFLPQVQEAAAHATCGLVDVRSPAEYSGEIMAPPGLPETCQRGGHIPGARSIPWGKVCREDGTFKSLEELKALYQSQGILPNKPVVTYCRIGERSSHSWFVLKYLLGYPDVRNYDGSWTEWGNLVNVAIERS